MDVPCIFSSGVLFLVYFTRSGTANNHPHCMTDTANIPKERRVVFVSKGTPDDDQFVLWLAPRLEAQGYEVFADIVTLEPGDRWRRKITDTLQNEAVKMLLCCTDATLAKQGVQEEIGIAEDLVKQLDDPKFIIPLRLQKFKKVFGIGELQYIDFEKGWAVGLADLLDALDKQQVPRRTTGISINPNWENYKRRFEIKLENRPERLTSNWLRILEVPDTVRYFQPSGAIDHGAMLHACGTFQFSAEPYLRGFFSFAGLDEINTAFQGVAKFEIAQEVPFRQFMESGVPDLIQPREASNLVMSLLRRAWENYCSARGLTGYAYSKYIGFHVSEAQVALGKKLQWGRQGERRSAMLRNKAQGKIWQYGVSASPNFFPYPHFRLKARVLFAEAEGEDAGKYFDDKKLQHRYRRTICKGWRNKQWHGRLMAFLELLSGEESTIKLPVGENLFVRLDSTPILFTSPVTTTLPDALRDEDEEYDDDTLGPPTPTTDDEEDE